MSALHLSSLIDLNLVFLKSPLTEIKAIYSFMVSHIKKNYPLKTKENDLLEQLIRQQPDQEILYPAGISIPHLHLDNFYDTIIAILIPDNPIITEHGAIKIFFMVISSNAENSLYIHILYSLVKISQDTELLGRLFKAKTAPDFRKIIIERDFAVKKTLTVGDIMHRNVITVTEETTLRGLSKLFYEHNFGYFPVIGEQGKVIGEVTLSDYMLAAFPAYTSSLHNLDFLSAFAPFERLLNEEDIIRIKNVMKPIEVSITPKSSIIEAVFLIHKYNRRDLPVLEDGKLVGIISFMNIFRKVIKE